MAEDKARPLPSDLTAQGDRVIEIFPQPAATVMSVEWFMECFTSQHNTLIFVSVVLLYPFYTMMQIPVIKACIALRIIAGAACVFDVVCMYISAALRWRVRTVTREGKTEQFMQDIFNLRRGPSRREGAAVLGAPFFLLTAAVFLFSLELVGYVWVSIPCNLAEVDIPPLNIVDIVFLQLGAASAGIFCGRSSRIIVKLGETPAPEALQVDQVAAVQEKV